MPRIVMETAETWCCEACGESDTVYASAADLTRAAVPIWCGVCDAFVCAVDREDLDPHAETPE